MVNVLATKPGINGANTLSIPKTWDSTWFRSFIANSLKGADVRNAVGANGITVTGTIASPYATISLGASPTVLGAPLTVKTTPGGVIVFEVTGNTTGITVEGYGPTAGALVDMTPDTGTFTGTLTGCTAAVNVPCKWCRVGNLVILVLNYTNSNALGTSNSTATTITGIPAAIQPTNTVAAKLPFMEDNGAGTDGAGSLSSAGTMTLFKGASQSGASWTAAGTKGLGNANTFAYILD